MRIRELVLVAALNLGTPLASPGQAVGRVDRDAILEYPRRLLLAGDRVIALERYYPFLKVVDLSGRVVQSTGRNGGGPGEFEAPSAFAYNESTRELVVFDPANARMSVFDVSDTLRFKTSHSTELAVEDACFAGTRLFVLAFINDKLVHELRRNGPQLEIVRDFVDFGVEHPLASNLIFREQVTQGRILCDPEQSLVWISSFSLNAMQQYNLANGTQRSFRIDAFVPLDFALVPGGLRQSIPRGGVYDETVSLLPAARGVRLILGRADKEHQGIGDYSHFRELAIDADGTVGQARSFQWQELGASNGQVVCYKSSPKPTLRSFSGSGCPQ